MKIVIGVLIGLGLASLTIGATLCMQSRIITQWSGDTLGYLREYQQLVKADMARGQNPRADSVLPQRISHLEEATRHQCSDLYDYSGAACGFTLMFSTLAIIVWRHQKFSDAVPEVAELTARSLPAVPRRQTRQEAARAGGVEAQQSVGIG
jgi:hypothetical protein